MVFLLASDMLLLLLIMIVLSWISVMLLLLIYIYVLIDHMLGSQLSVGLYFTIVTVSWLSLFCNHHGQFAFQKDYMVATVLKCSG